ncbi:MAG TPA: hypothetical protein VFD63_08880 [Pyrinomonadaceae bacterium]|nr:hypothetical protein [Pyrinomonadaceae bacterium]
MGDDGLSEKMRESLKNLRQGMLKLHKLLLDTERIGFERARGKINNSYEFLQLALKDPWFDWLHRLSELIVEVDEMLDTLDSEKAATEEDGRALIDRVRQLLSPSESGSEFQRNYFLALQQSPDVVLLHSELMKLLP